MMLRAPAARAALASAVRAALAPAARAALAPAAHAALAPARKYAPRAAVTTFCAHFLAGGRP
jgi:hypothetical protein